MFDVLHTPDRVVYDKPSVGPARQVQLKIVAIQAYQHNLNELGGGMTGTIDLEGSGVEGLVPDAVLGPPLRLKVQGTTFAARAGTEE